MQGPESLSLPTRTPPNLSGWLRRLPSVGSLRLRIVAAPRQFLYQTAALALRACLMPLHRRVGMPHPLEARRPPLPRAQHSLCSALTAASPDV